MSTLDQIPIVDASDDLPPTPPTPVPDAPEAPTPEEQARAEQEAREAAEAEAEARHWERVGTLFGFTEADLSTPPAPPPIHLAPTPERSVPDAPMIEGELVDDERKALALAGPLLEQRHQLVARLDAYVCTSQADYERAGELLDVAATHNAHVERVLGPFKQWLYNRWQAACGLIRDRQVPDTVISQVKRRAAAWRAEEERRRREEAARIAEAQRRAERERAEREARALEAAGATQAAEAIRRAADAAPPPPVVVEMPRAEGLVTREEWDFEVVDADLIPDEYWVLDTKAIAAVVRRQKEACRIPGIRVFSRPAVARRGGRR